MHKNMSVYVCHAIKYFNMTDFNGNLTLKVYVNKNIAQLG